MVLEEEQRAGAEIKKNSVDVEVYFLHAVNIIWTLFFGHVMERKERDLHQLPKVSGSYPSVQDKCSWNQFTEEAASNCLTTQLAHFSGKNIKSDPDHIQL